MKMMTSMSAVALVAALSVGGAMAQDTSTTTGQTPPAQTDMTTPPATTTPPAATTTQPPVGTSDTETTAGMAGAGSEQFVEMQQEGQWLASNLMGADIRGQNDEEIGDVKDVVLGQDGTPSAVVIGVGGFLGIGEKNVAVPFERLTVNREEGESDDVQIVLQTTKEELEQAPAFRTLEDAEAQASSGTSEGVTPSTGATGTSDAGTGGGMTTPPATQE
ncbi:PRC-barrel domain-containing protein [Chthonobacter rhizosphaerae]|uniref:PRC-barrel domain-containing protein n=1 Tax=Chthonobacter rhizosphaerae TaxID=2735553 RepID=UPI0015EE76DB|nr:PRC-barrel domain-containing protein [Chthonobacter rhizosphaerae]